MVHLTQAIIDSLFTFSALMSNMYSLVSGLELSENQLISPNLVEAEKICENGKWCMKDMKFLVIHSIGLLW